MCNGMDGVLMSEIKRVDGFGCGGCYNARIFSHPRKMRGAVLPAPRWTLFCAHPVSGKETDGDLIVTYHIIIDPAVRLDDCPLEEE